MIHLTERKKQEMEDVSYSVNLLNGMFFFVLILSSGFTDEILNCKYQKLLSTNIYVKHLLCLMILYYIDSTVISEQEHFPMIKFRNVIILYIIFIIVMRQNKNFTITFDKIKIFLNIGTFNLEIKTDKPSIIFQDKEIKIKSISTSLPIESIIKKFVPNYEYGSRREDQSLIIKESRLS